MKRVDAAMLTVLAAEANLAPSVHNTQPARWALDEEGRVLLAADLSRHLSVGDPTSRDMGLSCGAALEGMAMALAARRIGVAIDDLWTHNLLAWRPGYRLVARLELTGEDAVPPALCEWTARRFTWRARFSPTSPEQIKRLEHWAAQAVDVRLVCGREDLAFVASLNDRASLAIMRGRAFRDELVRWMRLSPRHPAYSTDGLNLAALQMGRLEGALAGHVLASPLFDIADRLGLGQALVAESEKTMTAAACLLFHRPENESPIVSGQAFYRFWLSFTRLGFAGWPMAVLADLPSAAQALRERFPLPPGHRLINVLRVGPAPSTVPKYRLPAGDLVLDGKPA
jgi:ribosomal protein S18 acetylase RimI-like enzyme